MKKIKALNLYTVILVFCSLSMAASANTFTCNPEILIQDTALTGGTGTGEGSTPGEGGSVTFKTGVSVSNFSIDLDSGSAEADLKIVGNDGNQTIDNLRTQCRVVVDQELYGNKKIFFCQAGVSRYSYLKLDVTLNLDENTVSYFDPDFIITTIHGGSALKYGNGLSTFADGRNYQTRNIPLAENGSTACLKKK